MPVISTNELHKLIIEELSRFNQEINIEEAKEDDVLAKYGSRLPYKEDWDLFVRWINEKEPRVQTEPRGKFRDGKSYRPDRIKYLTWGTKWLVSHGGEDDAVGELLTALKQFDKHAKQFKKKDINQYKDVAELKLAYQTDVLRKRSAKVRKKRAKDPDWASDPENAGIIYEDDRFFVVRPESVEGSCFYGEKTKWCISGKTVDPATGEITSYNQYYDQYVNAGKVFYFVKDDTANEDDQFSSIAIEMDREGIRQFWDRDDGDHQPDDIHDLGWPNESVDKMLEAIDDHFMENPPEDSGLAALEVIQSNIEAGEYNTDTLSFDSYLEDGQENPYISISATTQFDIELTFPALKNILATDDGHNDVTQVIDEEEEEIKEKIAELSPFDEFQGDGYNFIEFAYAWIHDGTGEGEDVLRINLEANLDTGGGVSTEDEALGTIEYVKDMFGDIDQLDEVIEQIREIFTEKIYWELNPPNIKKYNSIYDDIKNIEDGFEKIFASWDEEDPNKGISFVLAQALPIRIPVMTKIELKDVPTKWQNLGASWGTYYLNGYKGLADEYRNMIRNIVNSDDKAGTNLKNIFNDALSEYTDKGFALAKRQVQFDFPNFKMAEPENEFRQMGKNAFNKFDINIPVPIELRGESVSKPELRIRGSIDFGWTDTLEDIDFSMLWAQYIDKHWADIYKAMIPKFGLIEEQIRQQKKYLIERFVVGMENKYVSISARMPGAGNRGEITEWMKRLHVDDEAEFTIKTR